MNKKYRIVGYNGGDNHFCGNCRTPIFAIQFFRRGKAIWGTELSLLVDHIVNGKAELKEIKDKKTFERYYVVIDKG